MKKLHIIPISLIILTIIAGTRQISAKTILKEGNLWFRYYLSATITEEGLEAFTFIGSRYNFSRKLKDNGSEQPTKTQRAYLQEISLGPIIPLVSYRNLSIKGILAYSPAFYYIDERAGDFYVRHNLELHLQFTVQLHTAFLWYRNITIDSLPGKDGSGNDLKNQVINRHQFGFAFPITSWLVPIIDNEIYIRMNPDISEGEKPFFMNMLTGTLRFKTPAKIHFDLKYIYNYILVNKTADNFTIIHQHMIALWIRQKIRL